MGSGSTRSMTKMKELLNTDKYKEFRDKMGFKTGQTVRERDIRCYAEYLCSMYDIPKKDQSTIHKELELKFSSKTLNDSEQGLLESYRKPSFSKSGSQSIYLRSPANKVLNDFEQGLSESYRKLSFSKSGSQSIYLRPPSNKI